MMNKILYAFIITALLIFLFLFNADKVNYTIAKIRKVLWNTKFYIDLRTGMIKYSASWENFTIKIYPDGLVVMNETSFYGSYYSPISFNVIQPVYENRTYGISIRGSKLSEILKEHSKYEAKRTVSDINGSVEPRGIFFLWMNYQTGNLSEASFEFLPPEDYIIELFKKSPSEIFDLPNFTIISKFKIKFPMSLYDNCLQFPIFDARKDFIVIDMPGKIINFTFSKNNMEKCFKEKNALITNSTAIIFVDYPYPLNCHDAKTGLRTSIAEVCFR